MEFISWPTVAISAAEFFLTIIIIVWRMAVILEHKDKIASERLAAHELEDQRGFGKVESQIVKTSDEVRRELSETLTTIRANVMSVHAELIERISRVELETSKTYIPKDAFYATMLDMKNQNKDDFIEIKEWLQRLESKIDKP